MNKALSVFIALALSLAILAYSLRILVRLYCRGCTRIHDLYSAIRDKGRECDGVVCIESVSAVLPGQCRCKASVDSRCRKPNSEVRLHLNKSGGPLTLTICGIGESRRLKVAVICERVRHSGIGGYSEVLGDWIVEALQR